jgi:hypothetical protein
MMDSGGGVGFEGLVLPAAKALPLPTMSEATKRMTNTRFPPVDTLRIDPP